MEQVVAKDNMFAALRRVEQNGGAPGSDGRAVEQLRGYLKTNWERVKTVLLSDKYKPQAVRRVEIPKPDGGVRLLGIPNVVDRLLQQALLQVLSPSLTRRSASRVLAFGHSLMGLLAGTDEPILSKGEFRKVRAWLSTAIKYVAHLTKMSDATRRRLEDNLQALNRRSVGERHRAFWTGLGIERTRLEIDALLTRQPSVHEGHVGDEHADGVLRRNYELSCVLANLFNRAFLTALGWDGKYLDALPSDQHVERPLSEGRNALPSEKT